MLYAEEEKLAQGDCTHDAETQAPTPLHTEFELVERAIFGAYWGNALTSVVVKVCCWPEIKY